MLVDGWKIEKHLLIERKIEQQTVKMSLLYSKNFGRYFLTHFNVKAKDHIVVKICIRITMMVMKGVESSSRAKIKENHVGVTKMLGLGGLVSKLTLTQ